jgi:hypothetical protein
LEELHGLFLGVSGKLTGFIHNQLKHKE